MSRLAGITPRSSRCLRVPSPPVPVLLPRSPQSAHRHPPPCHPRATRRTWAGAAGPRESDSEELRRVDARVVHVAAGTGHHRCRKHGSEVADHFEAYAAPHPADHPIRLPARPSPLARAGSKFDGSLGRQFCAAATALLACIPPRSPAALHRQSRACMHGTTFHPVHPPILIHSRVGCVPGSTVGPKRTPQMCFFHLCCFFCIFSICVVFLSQSVPRV